MKIQLEQVLPKEIEERSFQIITQKLNEMGWTSDEPYASIVKRVIHTTADFDYVKNLVFSKDVLGRALDAIRNRAAIVTDTQMAMAGINKQALKQLGIEAYNFMGDDDVAQKAKQNGTTRADLRASTARRACARPGDWHASGFCQCRAIERADMQPSSAIHYRKWAKRRKQRGGGGCKCASVSIV